MKKIIGLLVSFSLVLCPMVAFAQDTSAEDNCLSLLEERNEALVDYLRVADMEQEGVVDYAHFFEMHPEYEQAVRNDVHMDKTILKTEQISTKNYTNEQGESINEEKDIVFYKDGSFRIDTFTISRDGVQMRDAWSSVCGQNQHESYNRFGAFMWRTYMKSCFRYNGSKVINTSSETNVRTNTILYAEKIGPTSSYPYGKQNLCRTLVIHHMLQRSNSLLYDMDDLRVSCNMQGEIFKN